MKLFVEEESVEQISEDTGLPRDVISTGYQRKAENEKHVFETEGGMKR